MTSRGEGQPLTFRALGAKLGVDPSALYRHVTSKDELLLAVADGIIGKALHGFQQTGFWREDLSALLRGVHEAYLDHPQVAVAAATRVTRLPAEMEFTETMLRILEGAGLSGASAVTVYRALEDTMLAWTGFRAAVDLTPNAEADHQDWEQVYLRADVQRFPHIVRQATPMTAVTLEQGFRTAMDLALTGVEAMIRDAPHAGGEVTGSGP